MAEVKKARLFLRRGSDTDRRDTVLCQGELGYSTDAFRIFIGDGSTEGGKSVGSFMYVSGGANSTNFHTNLTTASANGRAHKGDIAIFPAQSYTNAAGGTVTPHASASTVMILTAATTADGNEQATASSWVAVNSGIPFGNIDVGDDDISGDKVHGGVISGPITLSGGNINIGGDGTSENVFLSGVALSAHLAASDKIAFEGIATKVYPLGITGTSQITALSSSYEFENSGKDNMSNNYYYDYYGTAASGAAKTNQEALAAAISAGIVSSETAENSLLFVRNMNTRQAGGGNGGNVRNLVYIAQFILVGTNGGNASNWRMVSQFFNDYRGSFTTVGGTTDLAIVDGGVG